MAVNTESNKTQSKQSEQSEQNKSTTATAEAKQVSAGAGVATVSQNSKLQHTEGGK